MTSHRSAKDIVLTCIDALNNEDFAKARELVTDRFQFHGVMGSRDGADAYFADMKKMKFKYEIKKAIGDEHDVCVWSEMPMEGKPILVASWYRVEDDKIVSLRVVFDPRPLLDKAPKKDGAPKKKEAQSKPRASSHSAIH
jgi:predicted SnoaL-like aldol condensation-catalyzing enzyme